MYKTLAPGAINVMMKTLAEGLAAAKLGGFSGLEFGAAEIADLVDQHGADGVTQMFADAGIRPAAFGLPTDWRNSEANWKRDLALLGRYAKAAAAIGASRTFTWIMPCSNERPFAENRAFHVERFKPIAQTLGEHGISVGLEFIGPKTLRDSQKYPFIFTMNDMLDMAGDIGPNVGVLLDCWHWYTSDGTLDEIKSLRPEQVVYVHVNDAPAGVAIEEQIDSVRLLPGESGVIDIVGFLQALQQIGYDGPVTPEPFKKSLEALPSDEARLKVAGAAMDRIFRRAGV